MFYEIQFIRYVFSVPLTKIHTKEIANEFSNTFVTKRENGSKTFPVEK